MFGEKQFWWRWEKSIFDICSDVSSLLWPMSVRLSLVQLFVGVIVPISNEILFIPSIHCPLYPSLSLRATSLPSISPPSTLPCALGQLFDVAYLCCCGYVERNITMLPLHYVTLRYIRFRLVSFRFVSFWNCYVILVSPTEEAR